MPFPDAQVREVSAFNGPWFRTDAYSVPPDKGLLGQNVEYGPGQVGTRRGYTAAITNVNDSIPSIGNWRFSLDGINKSLLIYYSASAGAVKETDLADGSTLTLVSMAGAAGASFSSAGQRVYMSFYNTATLSGGQPQVYGWNQFGSDPLFPQPPSATMSVSNTSGGIAVTGGMHRFGFVMNTRSGYTTVAGPLSGASFVPVQFTAPGAHALQVSITATWPVYAQSVSLVMTTSADPNTYYLVPGATTLVATGFSTAVINVGISDQDLAATATLADVFTNQLSGSMACYHLFPASQRMCYLAIDPAGFPTAYFSEPNAYQSLTADQHAVVLPNEERAISGAQFRGQVIYLMAAHATYATTDNGDVPATWPVEQIDDKIGTLAPKGVCPTTGGIWVADQTGLYFFDGQSYSSRPISYGQDTDWRRINWGAAHCVEVVDSREKNWVIVKAPLDGSTSPTHKLRWDYTNGADADNVKYSLDSMQDYPLGGIAVVESYDTKLQEIWVSSLTSGKNILRQAHIGDTNVYRDDAAGIASTYEIGLLPGVTSGVPREQINYHWGAQPRPVGNGQMFLKVFTVDHRLKAIPARSPLILNTMTDPEPLVRWPALRAEHVSLVLSNVDGTGTAPPDSWWQVSYLKHYYNAGPPMR